jgi:hypothetical protein
MPTAKKSLPAGLKFAPELVAVALGAFSMLQLTCVGTNFNIVLSGQMTKVCISNEWVDDVGRLFEGYRPEMLAAVEWRFGENQAVAVVLFVLAFVSLLIRTRR